MLIVLYINQTRRLLAAIALKMADIVFHACHPWRKQKMYFKKLQATVRQRHRWYRYHLELAIRPGC